MAEKMDMKMNILPDEAMKAGFRVRTSVKRSPYKGGTSHRISH